MRGTWTIAQREWASFFRLPVGWVVIALGALISGVVFAAAALRPGEIASMRDYFSATGALLIVICPAVSMRLLSEEARTGTIEPLLTSPVSDASVCLGKYLGGLLFLLSMIAPSLLYVPLLGALSDRAPDAGPIVAGYLSLVLVGALYLAAGTLVSALTSSQTLAFLGAFLLLLVMLAGPDILIPRWTAAAEVLRQVSIPTRMGDFARGVIDLSHVVYFVTLSAWFVALSYLALASRRWR